MPLLDHLMELRTRLLWASAAFGIAFAVCYYFSAQIYGFLAAPLADILQQQGGGERRMIFTALYEAFFTYLRWPSSARCSSASRSWATQLWLFVAPGLYRSEKRAVYPFLIASPFLFVAGRGAGLLLHLPAGLALLHHLRDAAGAGRRCRSSSRPRSAIPLAGHADDPGLRRRLPAAGAADPAVPGRHPDVATLRKGRRYAIVGMFVVAAVLTPPDVISQIGLAVPLLALYELSILAAVGWRRRSRTRRRRPEAGASPALGPAAGGNRRTFRDQIAMHDIRSVRADPAAFDAAMARRGLPPVAEEILDRGRRPARRAAGAAGQAGAAQRPGQGDRPGQAKRREQRGAGGRGRRAARRDGGAGSCAARGRGRGDLDPRGAAEHSGHGCAGRRRRNRPMSCCASMASRRGHNFTPKQHFELGEALGLMDFAGAAEAGRGPFHRAARRAGAAGTCAGAVDADAAHRAARLYRDCRALPGQCRDHVRHRAACLSSRKISSRPPTGAT